MPHIIIKGMDMADIKKISKEMIEELSIIVDCPQQYFTIEVADSHFIVNGELVKKDPFIQINWFDRGQEVQDKTATTITKYIENAGCKEVEIFFTILERKNYYENGKHL